MNAKEIDPNSQHHIFEKIRGLVSTINSFKPFDVDTSVLLQMLETFANDIRPECLSGNVHALAIDVIRLCHEAQSRFADLENSNEEKSESLLSIYIECCKACIQIQNQYHITPKIWSDFGSKAEACVRGWTLGMPAPGSYSESKLRALLEHHIDGI
jgi:hypothetical protein